MGFSELLNQIGAAEAVNADISVAIYKKPLMGYTTWWMVGSSVLEIKPEDISEFIELLQGSLEFIEEDKKENVAT